MYRQDMSPRPPPFFCHLCLSSHRLLQALMLCDQPITHSYSCVFSLQVNFKKTRCIYRCICICHLLYDHLAVGVQLK